MKMASAVLARGHGEGAISMQSLGKRWGEGGIPKQAIDLGSRFCSDGLRTLVVVLSLVL